MKHPYIFGIRHLSPAGAWHLRNFLTEKNPRLVLVEGPSDLNDQMENLTRMETKPPIAILAYTKAVPVRTILYPFAEYSPEYQTFVWCKEHRVPCRFMDLPSDVFLSFPEREVGPGDAEGEEGRRNVYALLGQKAGEDGHETFWERTMEQSGDAEGYHEGANTFGRELRELSADEDTDYVETVVREAYMRRQIADAVSEGFAPEEIVVVTGAFHVEGLLAEDLQPMTDEEIQALPRAEASHTLMPYSYYRLSARSGYGAGNKAPAYYELLWEGLCKEKPLHAAYSYLSRIAGYQREQGNPVSSAEVIEAVRLAIALAELRCGHYTELREGQEETVSELDAKNRKNTAEQKTMQAEDTPRNELHGAIPALRDLRDAAVTCLGKGSFSAISLAVADTEIGTKIGALPEGVSRTSIQEDFYRLLKDLKLEKYRELTAQDLVLDLRENRRVSSEKSAFLDLNRSFFLHQLRVLRISFVSFRQVDQDNATWSEHWVVRWTPEAEIELVEAALKGDTVEQAASFQMKERVEQATDIGGIAAVIEDGFTCGMAGTVNYAVSALQAMAVDAVSVEALSVTVQRLSSVLTYGNIRKLDPTPLEPILKQMFYRGCLLLPGACVCDDAASKEIVAAMERFNAAALAHDFVDREAWLSALRETAGRDDLNTRLSGFAMAILLERGCVDGEDLKLEVQRRLSKGVPAELGAGWFEGLAMKNRYALIARLSLWEDLDNYLESLNDEEFKRALVFLRRAFADFTSGEKDEIAENLGEIWGVNGGQVSEAVNQVLDEKAAELVEGLEDFDFDL